MEIGWGRESRKRRRRRSQGRMARGGCQGERGGGLLLDQQNWLAGWLDSADGESLLSSSMVEKFSIKYL
jgi:hypothetical protein